MTKVQKEISSMQRGLEFKPASLNEEKRTVDIIWTTGESVVRGGFFSEPFIEELEVTDKAVDLSRLNNGAPLLNTHAQNALTDIIGVVERAWISAGIGYATVRFPKAGIDANADRIFELVKDGIARNISVGYRINKFQSVGFDTATGFEILRAVEWQPLEISFVPVPADQKSQVRSSQEKNIVTIEPVKAEGVSMEKPETAIEQEQEIANEEVKTPEAPAKEEPKKEEEATAEAPVTEVRKVETSSKNVLEIIGAVRTAGLSVEVAEKFIKENKSIDQVRKEIIDMVATKETVTAQIEAGRDESETLTRGIEQALHHKVNPKAKLEEGRQFAGLTMLEIGRKMLGSKANGMTPLQVARAVLISSGFPILMENIAQKEIIDAFKTASATFDPWVKKGKLSDFKQASRLMNSGAPDLALLAEGATITEGSVADSRREYNQLLTYAKNLVFSSQAIINNDLNTFDDLIKQFGIAAKRKESALVYTTTLMGNPTMSDSVALFHASHGNHAGAGTVLSATSLDAGFQAMASQMTVDGLDYADIMPKFLLVGLANQVTAQQLMSSVQAAQTSNVNVFASALQVIVDPRITGTNWFLAADPAINPLVEVAHFEGQDGPIVLQDQNITNDGITYSCRHYVGVKALDYRAGYYNDGTP